MRNLSLAAETSKKKDVQYCTTAVHPSMEFLMQLSVVGLFLVLLLYLYLAFTTINFLLWLCNLQVLKDLNPKLCRIVL